MPRARKSNCDLRKSIVREIASITNADRVSPGESTLSASARSSSETRSGGMVRDLALDMNSSRASQLRYMLSDGGVLRKFRECGFPPPYRRNRPNAAADFLPLEPSATTALATATRMSKGQLRAAEPLCLFTL